MKKYPKRGSFQDVKLNAEAVGLKSLIKKQEQILLIQL